MKYYIVGVLLFLSGCENNQINNVHIQPFLLHKYTNSFLLKYDDEQKIQPSNLRQFFQTLKSKKYSGRTTKYIALYEDKHGGVWSQRRNYLEKAIANAGLYAVKFKKISPISKHKKCMSVPISSYEAELNISSDEFGHSYYHNILQNVDDVSALFNEQQKPVLVDAKMSTAAINKLYRDSDVEDDTQDSDEAGAGDLQQDILSGLLGG